MAQAMGMAVRSRALEMGPGPMAGTVVAVTATIIPLPRLSPCNVWSPHEPARKRQGRGEISVPVQCNRPEGHPGNHMCLAGSFERLAEWEQAKVVK